MSGDLIRAIEFAAYLMTRDSIEARVQEADKRLKSIPGIGSGPIGLTPDCIKESSEFRAAMEDYRDSHNLLRAVNARNVKRFAPELARLRDERRAARLASSPPTLN